MTTTDAPARTAPARTAPARTAPARIVLAAVVDAVLIVAFAIAGRSSHAETLDPAGIWATAWPFLVGGAAGWLAARAWRRPTAPWPTGVAAWVGAVAIGMLLRAATDQGTAVPFVIVATLTLAMLLVGWRAVAALVARQRARRAAG